MFLTSIVSIEFPSLVGGAVGLIITAALARRGIGLANEYEVEDEAGAATAISAASLIKASFAIWATILVLIVTRIPSLGLKGLLLDESVWFQAQLGHLGVLSVSPSLVVTLKDMLDLDHPMSKWQHAVLYVPSILPFILVGVLSIPITGKKQVGKSASAFKTTGSRLLKPIIALSSALVMVRLLQLGTPTNPANTVIIGDSLSSLLAEKWSFFAVYLGAIGSFFSGSATVSNLTFGGVQLAIAKASGGALSAELLLTLQSLGASMGNMVCIHNIVAVCSILGLEASEGPILRKTALILALYGSVATAAALILLDPR